MLQTTIARFKSALTAFRQFQGQHPDSAYAPAVHFWVGSSQFALKDYKGAIASHQQGKGMCAGCRLAPTIVKREQGGLGLVVVAFDPIDRNASVVDDIGLDHALE